MPKSLIFSTALVVSASVLLAACTKMPEQNSDLNLSDSETYSLESNAELNTNNTDGAVEGAADERANMQPTNKQLEDFKQIAATQAVFTTSKGEIVIELFREQAPLTTANFLDLIDQGFYDGIIIHRVEPDFVVQLGDPKTKEPGQEAFWGTGGPGYTIDDEFHPELKHDSEGILSMANAGPNTGSSQVFITLDATPWLDNRHSVFGRVVSGMDIVKTLQKGDQIVTATYR